MCIYSDEVSCIGVFILYYFFFQAEDGIRDLVRSRGLGDVYKRQAIDPTRVDLLSEIAGAWFKLKNYPNSILFLNQKISQGKDVKAVSYTHLTLPTSDLV